MDRAGIFFPSRPSQKHTARSNFPLRGDLTGTHHRKILLVDMRDREGKIALEGSSDCEMHLVDPITGRDPTDCTILSNCMTPDGGPLPW